MMKKLVTICWFAALIVAALPGVGTGAQEPPDRSVRPTIRVTADATIPVKPDQAILLVGVVTQAATAQAAAANNATQLDVVLTELKKQFGGTTDVKTASYSLSPNYRYPREGGQPTLAGYTATNIVEVKTGDLKQLGKIIDVASQSGANNIQSLRFTLKDEQPVRTRALAEASVRARAKAEVLASALGLKVVRILRVEEGGGFEPRPYVQGMAEARLAGTATTPVETGTIEMRATVVLTIEVAQ
ncbi:MAG TPA: SIMPL domain-containing protein [Blastocatellia bacterium]|nr:SIMPL domain-containing protein [Blastocatellia bacterium]